jgi:putative hydrolases of HD superfamily
MNDVRVQPEDMGAVERFWELAMALKNVRRQGWIDRGVESPESVADHSWGVALLAWITSQGRADLNRDRILLLGLVHDLPEAISGDVTPFDTARDRDGTIPSSYFRERPVYSDDVRRSKQLAEARGLADLIAGLPPSLADEIRSAWIEYDEQSTDEAKYVKQIDKLETLMQARAYANAQPTLVTDSFRLGARHDVTDAGLRRLGRLDEPDSSE